MCCANERNIVGPRLDDRETIEMLLYPTTSPKSQKHATTHSMVCKRSQYVGPNNVASCWPTMLRAFARALRVGGQIRKADLSEALKTPIFLPKSSHITSHRWKNTPKWKRDHLQRNLCRWLLDYQRKRNGATCRYLRGTMGQQRNS